MGRGIQHNVPASPAQSPKSRLAIAENLLDALRTLEQTGVGAAAIEQCDRDSAATGRIDNMRPKKTRATQDQKTLQATTDTRRGDGAAGPGHPPSRHATQDRHEFTSSHDSDISRRLRHGQLRPRALGHAATENL